MTFKEFNQKATERYNKLSPEEKAKVEAGAKSLAAKWGAEADIDAAYREALKDDPNAKVEDLPIYKEWMKKLDSDI